MDRERSQYGGVTFVGRRQDRLQVRTRNIITSPLLLAYVNEHRKDYPMLVKQFEWFTEEYRPPIDQLFQDGGLFTTQNSVLTSSIEDVPLSHKAARFLNQKGLIVGRMTVVEHQFDMSFNKFDLAQHSVVYLFSEGFNGGVFFRNLAVGGLRFYFRARDGEIWPLNSLKIALRFNLLAAMRQSGNLDGIAAGSLVSALLLDHALRSGLWHIDLPPGKRKHIRLDPQRDMRGVRSLDQRI